MAKRTQSHAISHLKVSIREAFIRKIRKYIGFLPIWWAPPPPPAPPGALANSMWI